MTNGPITDLEEVRRRWAALQEAKAADERAKELAKVAAKVVRPRVRQDIHSGNPRRSVRSTPQSRSNGAEAQRKRAAALVDHATASPLLLARLDAGLTQLQAARKAGVGLRTWQRAEHGDDRLSTDVRRDIFRAFGVEL